MISSTLPALVHLEEGETGGPFDLINGMPVHPLVVHAAVVLVPLAAIGLIVMAFSPRFSRRYGWLVVWASIGGALFSFVAKQAGEALVSRVGQPGFDHAELGDIMPVVASLLTVATIALWLLDRGPEDSPRRGGLLRTLVAVAAVALALGNMFWMYRVGDSGAKSVWSGRVSDTSQPVAEPTASATPTASASASAGPTASPTSTAAVYTMAEVSKHNSAQDCWTAVSGNVYDLTAFEDKHPGGAQRIIDLCGTDGTAAFEGQHADESRPANELSGFQIGTLA